jgi:flagellar biosynthesis protein FliQ
MTEAYVITLAENALTLALLVAAPMLLTSLVIGILISLFQAATQISEATLTFLPKILGVSLVLALLGSWLAQQLLTFTSNLLSSLPNLPR